MKKSGLTLKARDTLQVWQLQPSPPAPRHHLPEHNPPPHNNADAFVENRKQIDPVRIESLETFGTPEEVGARVLKVEQAKDGTLDTKLLETSAEKQGNLSLYTLVRLLASKGRERREAGRGAGGSDWCSVGEKKREVDSDGETERRQRYFVERGEESEWVKGYGTEAERDREASGQAGRQRRPWRRHRLFRPPCLLRVFQGVNDLSSCISS